MAGHFDKHILNNGMVILGEPMEAVESAAFVFMLPAGSSRLPDGCCGAANVITDWIFRGAGNKDSRQLSDALDGLGLHRSSAVGSSHIIIGAALEADNLNEALELYADVILQPSLKDDQFEPARQLAIDGVESLDDNPRQKVMLELTKQFYPSPLGRSTVGKVGELKVLNPDKTKSIFNENFNLSQTIFSVAGKYDFDTVTKQMENLFEKDKQKPAAAISPGARPSKHAHINNDGAQVHIGLMTDTVKVDDENYYNARVAISVLSGGMSARLFTEVREKRGLCYAVSAGYHCLKDAAGIRSYAGTTPEKGQETLDVIMGEFNRLADGITEEEIDRAKVGLKSSLILHSESSSSRAGAIGSDYYMLNRVRGLDEIKSEIEKTSVDSVLGFLQNNRFKDFTVVTIGPSQLNIE
ncbi:M16 family metallopeptidase [Planctomycetota bacterium]